MKTKKTILLSLVSALAFSGSAYADSINTGNLNNATTTAGNELITNIVATPRPVIRFAVGGAKYTENAGELSVTIDVDTSTPAVTAGPAADQSFADDVTEAAYFGYYLSTAVRSTNQADPDVNIRVARGAGETANRSFYLVGNGAVSPSAEGDLTQAPALAGIFATVGSNQSICGSSHAANLSGTGISCANTDADMDITQFVKVAYDDDANVAITSQLEFIAVVE